jgi:hypothetical protein
MGFLEDSSMRRIWFAIGIVAFVISLAIAPALAQEAGGKAAPEKKGTEAPEKAAEEEAAAEPEKEEELKPVSGEKVEVLLREGDTIVGVVKGSRSEVMVNGRYRKAKDKEEPGAGIRVFYAMGLNGFLFVPYATIEEVTYQGELTVDEGIAIARRIAAERRASEQERVRIAEELAEKKRAAKEAAEKAEAGEESAEDAAEKAEPVEGGEKKLAGADRAKRIRELLQKYPPEEWKPSRVAEIKDRQLILNIYPTDEERGFMKEYDLWLEGFEIWKKSKATAEKK